MELVSFIRIKAKLVFVTEIKLINVIIIVIFEKEKIKSAVSQEGNVFLRNFQIIIKVLGSNREDLTFCSGSIAFYEILIRSI